MNVATQTFRCLLDLNVKTFRKALHHKNHSLKERNGTLLGIFIFC